MLARPRQAVVGLALAALALAWSGPARAESNDSWWGPDKALHFGVSAGIASGGYALSSFFLEAAWQRAAAGGALALGAGAAKELWDLSGHGDPSWRDFTWDVAGATVGVAVALLIDLSLRDSDNPSPGSATAPLLRF